MNFDSGGRIKQTAIVDWNDNEALRSKEDAADYRYFPDRFGSVVTKADLQFAEAAAGSALGLFLLDTDQADRASFRDDYALPESDTVRCAAAKSVFEQTVSAGKTHGQLVRGVWARWLNTMGLCPRLRPNKWLI